MKSAVIMNNKSHFYYPIVHLGGSFSDGSDQLYIDSSGNLVTWSLMKDIFTCRPSILFVTHRFIPLAVMERLIKFGVLTNGTGISVTDDGKSHGLCSLGAHIGVILQRLIDQVIAHNFR